ncbi:hypothetical protein OC846_005738 [Tilletia horrida]|uniref:CENP-V/GFA domain-containing protein n=1 Tax=Tilletia horrida TaxID=155126 RepID=A0AAN6JRE9_9BASI|nr:hypothetical protein OC846_005738 [Tilletia horrida]KAK0561264.1 hypothetical protein OC861_005907 [Tilletia horrida]
MSASHQQNLPLAGVARDGWSSDTEATATCFCGSVQIVFPTEKPGLVDTFLCHCTDCRKITASMFASNFTVKQSHTRYVRGEDQLKQFGQSSTIETGRTMTNHFCGNCGSLMFRVSSGFPDNLIMRIGTIDDLALHESKLKPRVEQYTKDRVGWLHQADVPVQEPGLYYRGAMGTREP